MLASALSLLASVAGITSKLVGYFTQKAHDEQQQAIGQLQQRDAEAAARVQEANDYAIRDSGVRALGVDALDSELRQFSRPGDKR